MLESVPGSNLYLAKNGSLWLDSKRRLTDNESDAISTVPRCPYRNCFPVLMFIRLASDLFGFENTIVVIENWKTTYLECSLYCLQRCTLFCTHTRCFGTHCCLQRPDMHSYHHTPPPVHMVQTTSLLKHNVTDHIHTMSQIIYTQCHRSYTYNVTVFCFFVCLFFK